MISDTAIAAITASVLSAIPAILIALATLKQGRANGAKVQEVSGKADQIHVLTNSALADVKKSLAVAMERIEGLEKVITSNAVAKKIADDLLAKPSAIAPRPKG